MSIFIFILLALFVQPLYAAEIQEFTADYEIYYGEFLLGKANYRFSNPKDNYYRLDFVSDLRFLIFSDKLMKLVRAKTPLRLISFPFLWSRSWLGSLLLGVFAPHLTIQGFRFTQIANSCIWPFPALGDDEFWF